MTRKLVLRCFFYCRQNKGYGLNVLWLRIKKEVLCPDLLASSFWKIFLRQSHPVEPWWGSYHMRKCVRDCFGKHHKWKRPLLSGPCTEAREPRQREGRIRNHPVSAAGRVTQTFADPPSGVHPGMCCCNSRNTDNVAHSSDEKANSDEIPLSAVIELGPNYLPEASISLLALNSSDRQSNVKTMGHGTRLPGCESISAFPLTRWLKTSDMTYLCFSLPSVNQW